MDNTPNYNLAKPESGKEKWDVDLNKNFDIIDDSLFKKEQSSVFVAKTEGISNIPHTFSDYNSVHDEIIAIYQGIELDNIDNYIENNNLSIDLIGWSLKLNEKIKFRIIRNNH